MRGRRRLDELLEMIERHGVMAYASERAESLLDEVLVNDEQEGRGWTGDRQAARGWRDSVVLGRAGLVGSSRVGGLDR